MIKAILNFQSVAYMDEHVEQDGRKKSYDQEAEHQERFEKIGHACSVEGIFEVSDSTACPYLMLADPTQANQSSALTVPKLTSTNPGHAAGAHWHG